MSLGTAWVGNVMLDAADKWTSPYQLVLPGITGPGWLVVQPLLTGNIVLDWALETFVHGEHEQAIAALPGIFAKDLLPPEGLTAFPWLNRPNPFLPGVLGAGMFSGLNLGVQRSDLYKALAASLTFEMERVFEDVRTARRAGCVVVGGGASKGGFFVQLLSALFHPLPVFTYEDGDLSGARGVLYALSRKVAKARARRAAAVPAALRDRVRKRYDEYIRLMSETYGACPAGGGLVFGSAGRTAPASVPRVRDYGRGRRMSSLQQGM